MTEEFDYLVQRLKDIESTFDSIVVTDPIEQSDNKYQDIIKSYVLLCHAEFEKYFEDIAIDVIETAKNNYDVKKDVSAPLLHLGLMLKKDFKTETAEERLNKLYSNYHALVEGNNGIKKKDIEDLLSPIGLDVAQLSDIYTEMLNNFGKKRGEIAHNVKNAIRTIFVYQQEKVAIQNILKETLTQIDVSLEMYCREKKK